MLMNTIQELLQVDRCLIRHPLLGWMTMLVALPIGLLAALFLCTSAVLLPISLCMGWL